MSHEEEVSLYTPVQSHSRKPPSAYPKLQPPFPPPPLSLLILRGPAKGTTISAPPAKRAATKLLLSRKPLGDLVIKDDAISERHALFEWQPRGGGGGGRKQPARPLTATEAARGAWTIRDLGSSNGTLQNGEDVVREGASHDLEDGDELVLGKGTVVVVQVR